MDKKFFSDNLWYHFLTGEFKVSPPLFIRVLSGTLGKVYKILPSNPHCSECGVPMAGFGGNALRFIGSAPSSFSSRLCSGCEKAARTHESGAEVELTIKGVEDVITFQAGFAANLGVIAALVGKQDLIFSDRLNHASIIDGSRLSGARIVAYEHNDVAALDAAVKENAGTYRRGLVVTHGVFSMDGDIASLPDLYEVTSKHGLMFMVDDAHREGVMGRGGRGLVDHFGLHGKVDIEVGTLSKAFGVVGGLAAGNKTIIEWLRQRGRPFLFSSAMTSADTAASIAAVELLETSTELVDKLWDNARFYNAGIKQLGFDIGMSQTPITPVMLGEAPLAQQFSRELFEKGVFAMAVGFPTVAKGKARIRVMISASHNREDLDLGLEAFAKVGKKLGVIQ